MELLKEISSDIAKYFVRVLHALWMMHLQEFGMQYFMVISKDLLNMSKI